MITVDLNKIIKENSAKCDYSVRYTVLFKNKRAQEWVQSDEYLFAATFDRIINTLITLRNVFPAYLFSIGKYEL